MSAEKTTWDKGKRCNLREVLPLDTPLSLNIEASRTCNIRCIYCVHSLSASKRDEIDFKPGTMDPEAYFKLVDDCTLFPKRIKTIRFAGYGEPLVNKRLAEMVAYTKQKEICKHIVVFTNALLLTPARADELVQAGVDVFRITVQGFDEREYDKNAHAKVDYPKFLNTLKHLYEHRGQSRIFIKMLDFAVAGRENQFYDMFGPLCDEIAIEYVTKAYEDVSYEGIVSEKNQYIVTGEHKRKKVSVCPYPFYMMTINADGNVSACCKGIDKAFFMGNFREEKITELWNNEKMNDFRRFLLTKTRFAHYICRGCESIDFAVPDSDNIDSDAQRLAGCY